MTTLTTVGICNSLGSDLWCLHSQNCGVLSDPPIEHQVNSGGQLPANRTDTPTLRGW